MVVKRVDLQHKVETLKGLRPSILDNITLYKIAGSVDEEFFRRAPILLNKENPRNIFCTGC